MSLYEARLQADLDDIRKRVERVGASVEEAIRRATRALLERDRPLAYQIVLDDLPINRATREIDRLCRALVARHSPAAGHLRFVSSVLRLSIALERIGDYAVTIARQSVQLSMHPPQSFARDVELLSKQSTDMLRSALKAFNEQDGELAKKTMRMEAEVDVTYDTVFHELLEEHELAPPRDIFSLLGTFNQFERVSDQAKNICEETIFVDHRGDEEAPKRLLDPVSSTESNACDGVRWRRRSRATSLPRLRQTTPAPAESRAAEIFEPAGACSHLSRSMRSTYSESKPARSRSRTSSREVARGFRCRSSRHRDRSVRPHHRPAAVPHHGVALGARRRRVDDARGRPSAAVGRDPIADRDPARRRRPPEPLVS